MQKLMYHGVGSQVHYIPVPFHPYYKNNFKFNHKLIKNSIAYYNAALSIPLYYNLKKQNQKKIVKTLAELIK